MSDLVKKLRRVRFAGTHKAVPGMCHAAADEIERLREKPDYPSDEIEELRLEIERLRDALRRIATRDYNETAQEFASKTLKQEDDDG